VSFSVEEEFGTECAGSWEEVARTEQDDDRGKRKGYWAGLLWPIHRGPLLPLVHSPCQSPETKTSLPQMALGLHR
jgi:hypothetical protein